MALMLAHVYGQLTTITYNNFRYRLVGALNVAKLACGSARWELSKPQHKQNEDRGDLQQRKAYPLQTNPPLDNASHEIAALPLRCWVCEQCGMGDHHALGA